MTDDNTVPGELLLAGGYVLSMDPMIGDLPVGDVHIRGGEIVAVAERIDAPQAHRVEAAGTVVLPGLVETHWHMWSTLLRALADGRGGDTGYFPTLNELGRYMTPQDSAVGVLLSCAEAIDAGYTTVHDWAQNVRGPEWADAELRALREAGLRGRFSYGWSIGHDNARTIDLADLRRVHADWAPGLLSLGMAWRGPGGSDPSMRVAPQIYRAELDAARDLGLPVTLHASGPRAATGQIAELADAELLGPDLQFVHGNSASDAEIAALAAHGCTASVAPFAEMLIGYGLPRTPGFVAAGIPTGLSVDSTLLCGNADPFALMRVTQAVANGQAEDEFALTTRRVLELATIDAARSLGMDGYVGSLTPGKRADVIIVSARRANLGVWPDPARAIVTAAQPANVDTVLVDGRFLKRDGRLVGIDVEQTAAAGHDAMKALLGRASW